MKFRKEKDSMGAINVPIDAYWGAQTQRSLDNFKIGDLQFPSNFIHAYAYVKKAAAITNAELGVLDAKLANLISQAADEIIAGKHDAQFPLVVWQTGSGTQTNMNVNEVIANRANEIAGKSKGDMSPVHPNDHVNKAQSTNDTFPTAMHVATVLAIKNSLYPAIDGLISTFDYMSKKYDHLVKMGRTHLQDATPITLGQEIGSWSAQLKDVKETMSAILPKLCELAAGGTAVGTGVNAHEKFAEYVARNISKLTGENFTTAPNKFAALAAHDALVSLSGVLTTLACAAMKIANDVRWLASGPRGGLGEITIAANEPGSSIMPGKVNPTQAEALTMISCQVFGNTTAVSVAGSQGNFQLNVFKPVIIHNVLSSIRLLTDGIKSFDENCAKSIEPNCERLDELKGRSLMLVTALAPKIGYDAAANIAKKALLEGKTLKEAALALGAVTEKEFDELVRPEKMVGQKNH